MCTKYVMFITNCRCPISNGRNPTAGPSNRQVNAHRPFKKGRIHEDSKAHHNSSRRRGVNIHRGDTPRQRCSVLRPYPFAKRARKNLWRGTHRQTAFGSGSRTLPGEKDDAPDKQTSSRLHRHPARLALLPSLCANQRRQMRPRNQTTFRRLAGLAKSSRGTSE